MAKKVKAAVTKQYKLRRDIAPLCFMLNSNHNKRSPLLYFDEEQGINRPLRYARNQKSPFEDEQDGNAILEPVVFEDGFLMVDRTNQVLQEFLSYHPGNGMIFEEIDDAKDAAEELEIEELILDAQLLARDLSIEKLETVSRVLMGSNADKLSTAELKRDILVYSRNYPEDFIDVLNDPALQMYDDVVQILSNNLLSLRNKNRDVYFNLPKNKTKILTVPYGEDPKDIVASYFQTDEGVETYKLLINAMKK
mgnify:FL=1|tara:strand:- start:1286 stop:2038 length:753 start_codon:yes stop_codon:yes gene_type:complete